MTVSKDALIPDRTRREEEEDVQPQQIRPDHDHNTAVQSQNPISVQLGRHHDAYLTKQPSMPTQIGSSDTFHVSEHGNTLVILHDDNDGVEGCERMMLYTEIPFLAVHGMQTILAQQPTSDDDDEEDKTCINDGTAHGSSKFREDIECPNNKSHPYDTDIGHHHNRKSSTSSSSSSRKKSFSSFLTRPLVIATACNSISQFLVGYNLVVLNTAEPFVFTGHTTIQWSWTVSSLAAAAPVGAMVGGRLADKYGRRLVLRFNSIGFLLAGTMQAFAPTLSFMTLSRFLLGIQSGIATVLVPLYLGELAPARIRGTLGTINQFALVVGILSASLMSFPFANAYAWRFLLIVTPILATIQLCLTMFLVESPRFLFHQNPNDSKAKETLKLLRGKENVDSELRTYVLADVSSGGKEDMFDVPPQSSNTRSSRSRSNSASIRDLMATPHLRFTFLCCLCLHVGQQLCGVSAVFYYSTSLFQELDFKRPLIGTTSIGAVNVMFTYFALLLMDTCKRKSLVLWSIGGMFVSCIGLIASQNFVLSPDSLSLSSFVDLDDAQIDDAASEENACDDDYYAYPEDYQNPNSLLALVSVNTYVAFYAIGFGPMPFLWIAEMVHPTYVALVMSVCSQLNWIINFIVGLLFPLMKEKLDSWVFVPFAVVLCICYLFVLVILPESKDDRFVQSPSNAYAVERIRATNSYILR